jgi:quercetin dioxygenase-like cupin family protein
MTRNGAWASHGLVAALAAALSAALTWGAVKGGTGAAAETAAPAGTVPLLVQPLADLPGREVRMILLDRPPGNASPPHRHPGHHTFGYVVAGSYELGIDGQATRLLKAGDSFYEPPGAVHSVSRNASASEGLKILVFMVADRDNPSTVNE